MDAGFCSVFSCVFGSPIVLWMTGCSKIQGDKMAGKSRAGQAGYHEGRDALGRKAWLADDKGPQKVSGKSSAQVLGDLHKDLESMSAGLDDAEIDQRYDNMLDSVTDFFDGCDDSSFAEDKVVFTIDSLTKSRLPHYTQRESRKKRKSWRMLISRCTAMILLRWLTARHSERFSTGRKTWNAGALSLMMGECLFLRKTLWMKNSPGKLRNSKS